MTRHRSLLLVFALLSAQFAGCIPGANELPMAVPHSDAETPVTSAQDGGEGGAPELDGGDAAQAPVGLSIVTAELPAAEVGKPYQVTLEAEALDGSTLTWEIADEEVPTGLGLAAAELSGVPLVAGQFSLTFVLSDGVEHRERTLVLTVKQPPELTIEATTLAPVLYKTPYQADLTVRNHQGALSWSVASGELPEGLAVSKGPQGVVLSGNTKDTGFFCFELEARDGAEQVARRRFCLRVHDERSWVATSITSAACAPNDAVVTGVTNTGALEHPRSLAPTAGDCAGEFAFSPDGRWLYFRRTAKNSGGYALAYLGGSSEAELAVTRLDPEPRALIDALPTWSPDGGRLLYWSQADDGHSLRAHLVDTRGDSAIVSSLPGLFATGALWSPDGKKLVLRASDETALWLVTFEGGTPELGDKPFASSAEPLTPRLFSADSERFVYSGHDGVWVRAAERDAEPLFMTGSERAHVHDVPSPDGRRLSGFAEGEVFVLDVGSEFPRVWHWMFPELVAPDMADESWAPDGSRSIVLDHQGKAQWLLKVEADAPLVRLPTDRLLEDPLHELYWVRFTPGARMLASVLHEPDHGIVRASGGLYEVTEKSAMIAIETYGAPVGLQYAMPEVVVMGNEVVDFTQTVLRAAPFTTEPVQGDPVVDPIRARIYYYAVDSASLQMVHAVRLGEPAKLHVFNAVTGDFQMAWSP